MRRNLLLALNAVALAALLTACASPSGNFAYTIPNLPESPLGYAEKPGWATTKFAVAAANPWAADAGYQVLR